MEEYTEKRKLEGDHFGAAEKKQATDQKRNSAVAENDYSAPITVNMACPYNKVASLIGKKGVVVQEIMKRSGCKIYVDQNFPEGQPRNVLLTGNPKSLTAAMTLIAQVLEIGPTVVSPSDSKLRAEGKDEDSLFCPQSKVGILIGQKGANITEIFRKTGCKVQIMQDGIPDGVDRKISFIGSTAQITEAKAIVSSLINETSSKLPGGSSQNIITEEMEVLPDKVRNVIGSKGITITEIIKKSGCKVSVNQNFPEGETHHKVLFIGDKPRIEIAKYLVETVVNFGFNALNTVLESTDVVTFQEVTLFENQLNRLLSNTEFNINTIQTKCGIKIIVAKNTNKSELSSADDSATKLSFVGRSKSIQSALKLIFHSIQSSEEDSSTGYYYFFLQKVRTVYLF
jgi:polyribonucleotide nucleotidyltransferase